MEENLAFFRALRDAAVFPDEGKKVAASADFYQQAIAYPEKAVYWRLTIEFGRMYEKMQREWCDYCIRTLEEVQQKQDKEKRERESGR